MIVVNIDNISAKVLATPLTGLDTALTGVITSTDTVLQAFGKIQNQITNIPQTNPGGANRQVQWNNNGVFGASPELTFFGTNRLSLGYAAPVDAGYRLDVNGTVRMNASPGANESLMINASSASYRALAIGTPEQLAIANGVQSTAIGPSAQTGVTYSTAIGAGAFADANSNIVISSGTFVNIVTFGPRQLSATPGDTTIRAMSGSGSNINGASIYIQGGRPTGNGLSGDVIFSTATAGASGTTLRNLTDRWVIKGETGHLQALGAFNILLDTVTGSKIGGNGAKLAFYDNTPIAQPTTAVAAATYVHNASSAIHTDDTFDGYTLAQLVRAMRLLGGLT